MHTKQFPKIKLNISLSFKYLSLEEIINFTIFFLTKKVIGYKKKDPINVYL